MLAQLRGPRSSDETQVALQHFHLIASCRTPDTKSFRRRQRDFSRDGTLSPNLLLALLLFMIGDAKRRGYRHLLDAFWDEAQAFGLPLPSEQISAPAFCKARHKVTPDLLRQLTGSVAEAFEERFDGQWRWQGRRVFAVDGSKVSLQRSPDLDYAFGRPEGGHCPQVLVSTLLNVVAKVPVDVMVAPYGTSEREELIKLLPTLRPGDVLVLDRGYPSFDILTLLSKARIDFLVRIPADFTFKAVGDFREAAGDDYRLLIAPPQDAPRDAEPLEVRAVRHYNDNGDETIYLTSLRRAHVTYSQIAQLYHMRWQLEEFYKQFKSPYIGQGQFRSQSPSGIRQEVHAAVLYLALTRYLMAAAAACHDIPYDWLSPKSSALGLAAYVTRLFLEPDHDQAARHLQALLSRIVTTRDPKRPHRSFPRRSFKPGPRWGPKGRRGG